MVKKFKASLDRSGVHDDIRQMGQQIETTWNDMRRGLEKSWSAVRQSAEGAIIPQFGPEVAIPALKLQDAFQATKGLEPSLASHARDFTLALNRMKAAMSQPTAATVPDSGRLDEWIERANRVLADAMIEKEVTMEPVPAQENDEKTISKKSSLVEKVAKKLEPAYSETISFFSVKPRKGKALAGDKKNTAL